MGRIAKSMSVFVALVFGLSVGGRAEQRETRHEGCWPRCQAGRQGHRPRDQDDRKENGAYGEERHQEGYSQGSSENRRRRA